MGLVLGVIGFGQMVYAEEFPPAFNNRVESAVKVTGASPEFPGLKIADNQAFGSSVDMEGNILVVGAPRINDFECKDMGAVYVMEWENGNWSVLAKLTPSQVSTCQHFGARVAIHNDVIVVVLPSKTENDQCLAMGSVYVYKKPETGWTDMTETALLTTSDDQADIYFGSALAVSDSVIAVGAIGLSRIEFTEFSSSVVNIAPGRVYVYEKNGADWQTATETAVFSQSQKILDDDFCVSLAISPNEEIIAAGAPWDESVSPDYGLVYLFEKTGDRWQTMTETFALSPSDPELGSRFGHSLAFSGESLFVGAPMDDYVEENAGSVYQFDCPSTGWVSMTETRKIDSPVDSRHFQFGSVIDPCQDRILMTAMGWNGCYIYHQENGTWVEEAQLSKNFSDQSGYYGSVAALSDRIAVFGSFTTNVLGKSESGAVLVYERSGETWSDQTETRLIPDPQLGKGFGYFVAVEGDTAVVGSEYTKSVTVLERSNGEWSPRAQLSLTQKAAMGQVALSRNVIAVGVPADGEGAERSGAIYLFEKPSEGWKDMTETAKLKASQPVNGGLLGWNFAFKDDVLAAFEFGDSAGKEFVVHANTNKSRVLIFEKPAEGWKNMTETAELLANESDNFLHQTFGFALAIEDDTILVGAPGEDRVELDFDGTKRARSNTGAAYIYRKNGERWSTMTETAKIVEPDAQSEIMFGGTVGLSSSVMAIGTHNPISNPDPHVRIFDKPSTGWQDVLVESGVSVRTTISRGGISIGNQVAVSENLVATSTNSSMGLSNLVFLYMKPSDGWVDIQHQYGKPGYPGLTMKDTTTAILGAYGDYQTQQFGQSIGLSNNTLMVGDPRSVENSGLGAVYFFELVGDSPVSIQDWSLF